MNKKYVPWALLVILLIISFLYIMQSARYAQLKKIEKKYTTLTRKFNQLSHNYEQSLEEYRRIHYLLQNNQHDMDSLVNRLDSLSAQKRAHLDSVKKDIESIMDSIKVMRVSWDPVLEEEIVNTDSIFSK